MFDICKLKKDYVSCLITSKEEFSDLKKKTEFPEEATGEAA